MKTDELILRWLQSRANNDYAIANRLLYLNNECNEEEEPLSDISLFALMKFLEYHPSLTVNPQGEISATWKFRGHELIIRFKDNGDIQPLITER